MAFLSLSFQRSRTASSKHDCTEISFTQAPHSLQGLLIGIWYATFSILYLVMRSLDHVITSPDDILIYQVVRTSLLLLPIMMYMCVSHGYQWRVRDWVVNLRWMVEDVFDRRVDQEESYIRWQMAKEGILFEGLSSDSDSDDSDHSSN